MQRGGAGFFVNEDKLEFIIEKAVNKAVTKALSAYKTEQTREERRKERLTSQEGRAKQALKMYRTARQLILEMGRDPEQFTFGNTNISLAELERAVMMYRDSCEKGGLESDMRRYRELVALFLSDDCTPVVEIAKTECVSEKTIYKDMGIAIKSIASFLFMDRQ